MSSLALYRKALSWHCFDGNAAVVSLCVETVDYRGETLFQPWLILALG